jgi:hypothetical protein
MAKGSKQVEVKPAADVMVKAADSNRVQVKNVVRKVFELSGEQQSFAQTLTFVTEKEMKSTPKASRDVPTAFDDKALATISDEVLLGGPERASDIQRLTVRHRQLEDLAERIEPLSQLVAQNLVVTGAALAEHANLLNKLARVYSKTRPQLSKGLKSTLDWSKKHHAAPRKKGNAPPKQP